MKASEVKDGFAIVREWAVADCPPCDYVCPYCDKEIGTDKGIRLFNRAQPPVVIGVLYQCPRCKGPTIDLYRTTATPGGQFPVTAYGRPAAHAPEDLTRLYNEARDCYAAGGYTASAMLCRKMLMNIAVDKEGLKNKQFAYYVDYLIGKGYAPPGNEDWVKHIKDRGNEANHEIEFAAEADARRLIDFTWSLMFFIYEMPGAISA